MNINTLVLVISLFLICVTQTNAQITINGTITDNNLNPIPDILVEVIDEADTNNIYTDYTDVSGNFAISNITAVDDNDSTIPSEFIILTNYPNPFNPSTVIYFELPGDEEIDIKIFDILGREVRSLYNGYHSAGSGTVLWDGRNSRNTPVSSGVYFCRLKIKERFKVHKMVCLGGGHPGFVSGDLGYATGTSISKLDGHSSSNPDYELYKSIEDPFIFTIRASGENIIATELNHILCERDTTIIMKVPRVLESMTIGSMGGEISVGDLKIEIPVEAFHSDIVLRAFEMVSDDSDESNALKSYGIEGLPIHFSKPLTVTMEPETVLTGESFIAVGQEYEIPFINSSQILYNFMDTQESSGVLTCQLSSDSTYVPHNVSKTVAAEYIKRKMYFRSNTGLSSYSSDNNYFKIFSDQPIANWLITQLMNILQHNYEIVKNAGFDTENVKLPVEVYVKDLKPNLKERGCYYFQNYGLNNISLMVDKDRIGGIAFSSLREYLIGVLRLYDKEFFLPFEFTGKVNPERYWFHHAVASWFEEKKWTGNDEYIPIDFYPDDNRKYPFLGLRAGAGNDALTALRHGGGMSSFIKYIHNNYGEAPIMNMYNLINEDKMHPIEAIKNTLGDADLWWPDYFEDYLESRLYKFDKITSFEYYDEGPPDYIQIFGGSHRFKEKNDTLKEFKDIKFSALSAKAFYIDWDPVEIDIHKIMLVSLKEPKTTMFVYGYVSGSDDPDNYLLLGKGCVFSRHISTFIKENISHLVIIVTNNVAPSFPYTETSNITLDIRLKDDTFYKYCDIKIGVVATKDTTKFHWSPRWYTVGTLIDNEYTGTINKEKQGGDVAGQILVKVDDNFTIKTFAVMANYSDEYGTSQWGFTASNIPPIEKDAWVLVYNYRGNDVCNYIKSVYGEYTYSDGDEIKISGFECDADSYIHIKFHNWD